MPTLATGTSASSSLRAPRAPRGFTLIELMVVVFIIGVVAAGAVIAFGGQRRDSELEQEAQRLDALFGYVREQAELQTRDYGFRVNAQRYSFVVFDVLTGEWRQAEEDDALRERAFPEGIVPTAIVEGRAIILDVKQRQGKKELEDFTPQIMIFANGDISSFDLRLTREGSAEFSRLYTDDQTNVRLLQPGELEQKGPPVRAAASR